MTVNKARIRVSLRQIADEANKLAQTLERHDVENEENFEYDPEHPLMQFDQVTPNSSNENILINASPKRQTRQASPNPRYIRKIIRQRHLRVEYFDRSLFQDPAWDMLLDLLAAREESRRISITSACLASIAPPTTALRYLQMLQEHGLVERINDTMDKRRTFVQLTEKAVSLLARYFSKIS